MSFITIDPYYDVNFYNKCKESLKNNKIEFTEFLEIKSPYRWFFKLSDKIKPVMIDYDEIDKNRFLVRKIQALRPNEEYLLQRKGSSEGTNITRYIYNDAFNDAKDYGIFINISGRDELIRLSREFSGKIYYLGKYYGSRFKVCLVNNPMIKNYIQSNQILLEKTPDIKEPGRFEAEFNYKILKYNDFIYKTIETIYGLNGSIIKPKVFDSTNAKYNI